MVDGFPPGRRLREFADDLDSPALIGTNGTLLPVTNPPLRDLTTRPCAKDGSSEWVHPKRRFTRLCVLFLARHGPCEGSAPMRAKPVARQSDRRSSKPRVGGCCRPRAGLSFCSAASWTCQRNRHPVESLVALSLGHVAKGSILLLDNRVHTRAIAIASVVCVLPIVSLPFPFKPLSGTRNS
jgi:hypothetical protein